MAAVIRPYREADLDAVYDVCVRTADGGADARGKYRSDDLMPDLFAGPYVFLEPDFAFVLDDGRRAVGRAPGPAGPAGPAGQPGRRDDPPALPAGAAAVAGPGRVPGAPAHRPAAALPGGRVRACLDGDVLRRGGAGRGRRGAPDRDGGQRHGHRLLPPPRLPPARGRRSGREGGRDRGRLPWPQALTPWPRALTP